MERHRIRAGTLALLALGLAVGACRRPERAAADSAGAVADSVAAANAVLPDTALAVRDTTVVATDVPGSGAAGTAPARAGARPAGATRPAAPAPAPGGRTAPPATPAAEPAQEDTVRGIVAEVGSVPITSIVVRPAGGRSVTMLGSLAKEIGRAAGAEVWVSGHRTPEGLHAMRYAVRAVDGEPAVDGVLASEDGGLVLVTAGGRRRIVRPPQALRGMVGARVWLVGPIDGGITSYGVLREAP
jgi:hypothetical protein